MARILVVDDEPADRHLVRQTLEKGGHTVITAATAAAGLECIHGEKPDVAILDILLPDGNGLDVYRRIQTLDGKLPVIFVTASGSSETAIEAMQLGALDYLVKPLSVGGIQRVVTRALDVRRMMIQPVTVDPPPEEMVAGDVIIGRSPAMQEVYKAIGLVAAQNVTVLLRGESGTGKELVARAVYRFSRRADGPFLPVNCAAIPEPLLESELFGHERGAFTGADRRRIGKFEQCSGGTLFLDEIGDMPPLLQAKLLRVLQEQQFERVGGNQTIRTDARVIAATNRDLEKMVVEKLFREDLYYRLNGFTIDLPPLRHRGRDLDLLVDHFLRQAACDMGKDLVGIAPAAMDRLRHYAWPGNVRELQNVICQAALKATGPVLLPDCLPPKIGADRQPEPREPPWDRDGTATDDWDALIERHLQDRSGQLYDAVVRRVEERLVQRVLDHVHGDRQHAVRLLGVDPSATFRSPAAVELLGVEPRRSGTERSTATIPGDMTIQQLEREAIRRALDQTNGHRGEAARLLGLSVRTLQRKIKQYNLVS